MTHLLRLLVAGISAAFVPVALADFPDLPPYHLYKEAVEYASEEGLVTGYPDGTFQPDRTVNRAEFITLIDRFFQLSGRVTSDGSATFTDTNGSEWFAAAVRKAVALKLVGGYPDGSLQPGRLVSFAEASKILARVDQPEIAEGSIWYEPFVRFLANRKAIPLTIKEFTQPLTRGEVMEMLWRLKEKKNTLASRSWEELRSQDLQWEEPSIPKGYTLRVQAGVEDLSMIQSRDGYVAQVVHPTDQFKRIVDTVANSILGYHLENQGSTIDACHQKASSALRSEVGSYTRDPYIAYAAEFFIPPDIDCAVDFGKAMRAAAQALVISSIPGFMESAGKILTIHGDYPVHSMVVPDNCDGIDPMSCETFEVLRVCQKELADNPDAMASECVSPLEKLINELDSYVFINGYKMGPFARVGRVVFNKRSASIFSVSKDGKKATVIMNGKEVGTYDAVGRIFALPSGRSFSFVSTDRSPVKTEYLMVNGVRIAKCSDVPKACYAGGFDGVAPDLEEREDGKVRLLVDGVPGEWLPQ